MTDLLVPGDAKKRINEIAEELARGTSRSRGESIIELRRLCGHHRIVPTSYRLAGVKKEGDWPQHISNVIGIWKGRWNGEAVALKILRWPREDPEIQRAKSRFCKEVALMKQLNHNNILPFYGVSETVSDFCLVFPWYRNGNIVDYLKANLDINQFNLLSDAASGLRYLHDNRLVHGFLRPSHILVDDRGTARLATGGRSSVVAVPETSFAGHVQSGLGEDINDYRYMAPELQSSEEHDVEGIDKLATKESDVYGMGMVVYRVLTGSAPYSGCDIPTTLEKMQIGELPQRPSGVDDVVWEFLQKCWSRDPTKRPPTAQVCDAFSQFCSLPRFALGKSALPGDLMLQVQSIKISLDKSKQPRFFVKLKYGNKGHTTPLAKPVDGSGEHTWNGPERWVFKTKKSRREQSVSIELFLQESGLFKKGRVYATGNFLLLNNNVNKQTHVKLEVPDGTGSAVLKILLSKM